MFDNVEELEKQVKAFQENILASSELLNEITSLVEAVKAQRQNNQANHDVMLAKIDGYTREIRAKTDELYASISNDVKACVQNVEQASIQTTQAIKDNNETAIRNAIDRLLAAQRDYVSRITEMDVSLRERCASMEQKLTSSAEEFGSTARQTVECIDTNSRTTTKAAVDQLIAAQRVYVNNITEMDASLRERCASMEKKLESSIDEFGSTARQMVKSIEANEKTALAEAVDALRETQHEYIEQIADLEASIKTSAKALEEKHKDFLARLEATNVDQLFKLCQDMKKTINRKLVVALVGVGVAIAFAVLTFFLK